MTSETLLNILEECAKEDAEDITLQAGLEQIVDLGILLDKLDFEYGVTPPLEVLEDWTGEDLLEFYKE